MKIKIYPRSQLELLWQEDKQRFAPDAAEPPACLRCGKPLAPRLVINALSRYADVYICDNRGTDEALRDAIGEPLPLRDWHAVSNRQFGHLPCDAPELTPVCVFDSIFTGPQKRFPLSSVEHPVSEIAYSRSDYSGHKWWWTWFRSDENKIESSLAREIDQFSAALLEMPDFQSLDTMAQMCRFYAQPADDDAEFNLYSETQHFYIWLRLITRPRDYNLYVHFYMKTQN